MPLPNFDSQGELPAGVHQATMDELITRFGSGTPQRQAVTTRVLRIYNLLKATGKLEHLIIFGRYVTTKPNPNDVDLVLVLADDFNLRACDEETRRLFEHTEAAEAFGASIFWIRPSMLLLESLEEFIAHWQINRRYAGAVREHRVPFQPSRRRALYAKAGLALPHRVAL